MAFLFFIIPFFKKNISFVIKIYDVWISPECAFWARHFPESIYSYFNSFAFPNMVKKIPAVRRKNAFYPIDDLRAGFIYECLYHLPVADNGFRKNHPVS